MIDETQEYVLVNEQEANIEIPLSSINKRPALYEALELLGWQIVKRDKE